MQHFKTLRMYILAKEVCLDIYRLSDQGKFEKDRDLKNQIRRAAISVLSNIAEGFRRNSTKDECRYMEIAKTSACEVMAQRDVAHDLTYIDDELFKEVDTKIEHTIRMISKYISSKQ